jgi:threonine dehydrogenase-like Zn-dependent dehydrogenase
MATGKGVVLVGYHKPLEVWDFEIPEVEPGATLLKMEMTGICGTDVHVWEGKLDQYVSMPMILGHEPLGTIYKLGEGVTGDMFGQPVKEGDLVFPYVLTWCGRCYHCLRGDYTTCQNLRALRPATMETIHDFPRFVGGYAEYTYLRPGISYFKIPHDLPLEAAAAFSCGGPTVTHALWHDPIRPGESVVVQGTGPVGLYGALVSKISGARQIISIGAPAHRLEMAQRLGADETINIEEVTDPQERVKQVREMTDGVGPDVVLECSGNPSAVLEGIGMMRNAGRYFVIGQYSVSGSIPLNPEDITLRELKLQGSQSFEPEDVFTYLNVLREAQSRFPLDQVVSHKIPLEKANEALEAVRTKEAIRAVLTP